MNRRHRAASNRAMYWRTTLGIAAFLATRAVVAQADDRKDDLVGAAKTAAHACENGGETETSSAESSAGCRTLARIYEKYPAFIANEKLSAALLRDERAFCDGGLLVACRNVAFAIEHGIGTPVDDAAAAKIYADACVHGNSAACVDARALQIISPNAITGLPELTPSKEISASEKNWSDEYVKSAAAHLERCANGDSDECVLASEFFWSPGYGSELCGAPPYYGPALGAFPDPERALRIASLHCEKKSGSKCGRAIQQITERGLAINLEHPDIPLCDYRDRDAYDGALEKRCLRGNGDSCLSLVEEIRRRPAHLQSRDGKKETLLLRHGCDFGEGEACDELADDLETRSPDKKAQIASLRKLACEFDGPRQECRTQFLARNTGFFAKPVFLSFGAIASFANPNARGTLGGEVTLVHWSDEEIEGFGLGGYAQAEYVAGGTGRASLGFQANAGGFGIETGYAYQRLLEDKRNQNSMQITPFVSIGIAHVGFRLLVPISPSGAPVGMLVLGLKVPINVGKKVETRSRMHWLGG